MAADRTPFTSLCCSRKGEHRTYVVHHRRNGYLGPAGSHTRVLGAALLLHVRSIDRIAAGAVIKIGAEATVDPPSRGSRLDADYPENGSLFDAYSYSGSRKRDRRGAGGRQARMKAACSAIHERRGPRIQDRFIPQKGSLVVRAGSGPCVEDGRSAILPLPVWQHWPARQISDNAPTNS